MSSLYINISFAAYFLATVAYLGAIFFKKRILLFLARCLMIFGVAGLTLYMATRWYIAQRPPLSDMFESLIVFAWSIALATIFVDVKYKIRSITGLSALMSLLTLGYASLMHKEITPLMPALKSNWLTIHVLTCFIGYASLTVAFVASVISVATRKKEEELDLVSYNMIAFGFIFLALGIITGSVWANEAWGTYWSWDPKETWSLITWFVYAIYLHIRYTKGWRGRKAAWLSIVGFLAMLFTYFGVNYLLSGLHSYT